MNNLAMGSDHGRVWDYYKTIGGGMGAGSTDHGLSAVQTHMTNTLNTPIEVIESAEWRRATGQVHLHVDAGDQLSIETPGGGGFGKE